MAGKPWDAPEYADPPSAAAPSVAKVTGSKPWDAPEYADPVAMATAPALAPPELPVIPRAVGPYATSVATSPQEARKEIKGQEVAKLRSDAPGVADAIAYGAARGLTPGRDRFVGLGASIGEGLASAVNGLEPEQDTYSKARGEYLANEDTARKDHPWAYGGAEIGAGIPIAVATGKLPVGRFAQSAIAGGAAGGLNTTSDDPLDIAKGTLGGAAGGLAVEGTIGTAAKWAIRGAPKREENALIRDIMESESGRATPTTGAKLARDINDVRDILKTNTEVAHAVRLPADEARPVLKEHMRVATEGQPQRYEVVDRALAKDPLTVTQLLTKLVDAEKGVPDKELPLVKRALLAMRDSVREDFAPRWSGGATWQGERVPISAQQLRGWVSSAQSTAERAMGGINGTNAFKVPDRVAQIANGILEERLDMAIGKGAKQAVDGIRESDRVFSALKNIDRALEDRGKKELAQSVGISTRMGQQSRGQELAAAAGLAATGHPGPAVAVAAASPLKNALAKGVRFANDEILAPLQRAAEAGKPWAEFARMASEQGLPQSTARAMFERYERKPYVPPAPPTKEQVAEQARGASNYGASTAIAPMPGTQQRPSR